ncbi:MAG: hypothetical protein HYX66_07410 [Ignavibacteria bacterium]|nr:hypothetical protein [Ignavibacteria bacterium]
MYRHLLWASFLGTVLLLSSQQGGAQQRAGEVAGFLSFAANKYSGEFTDDLWGFGGFASLQYAPMSRLLLEGRVGLGEIKWGITPSDLARYPDYFGRGAKIGDNYPGTITEIESENESRITTADLLMHYVIVDRIAAVPFITVGIGLVNFSPATNQQHEALPNNASGLYSTSAFSIPVGGGVRIPFSNRVGLLLRAEHRFVFTQYLDDVAKNGSNDGITSLSIGLTYAFTPGIRGKRYYHDYQPCNDCDDEDKYDDKSREHGGKADVHDGSNDTKGADITPETPKKGTVQSDSAKSSTLDGSESSVKQDTAKSASSKPPKADTVASKPPKPPVDIKPCPPGTERACVSENESVCVVKVTPGAERIRWEDAFIYEPGQPLNKKTLLQADQPSPRYGIVVRQTANSYYMCVECQFEKAVVNGAVQYQTQGEAAVVKGAGTFNPADCPDCEKVVQKGQ